MMKFAALMSVAALVVGGCAETQIGSANQNGSASLTTGAAPPKSSEGKVAQVPKCAHPLATLALEERQIAALATMGLTSPLPVVQAYVSESNCFRIVDPNAAAIAARHGAKGKPVVPDYVLTADILSQNANAGGATANVGQFLPGVAGQVLQSISVNVSEVKTTLTLADTRSGLQVAHVLGQAQTTDVGASFGQFTRHGSVSFGAYGETPIGRTTSAALLDAYVKLVQHVQALPPKAVASARR